MASYLRTRCCSRLLLWLLLFGVGLALPAHSQVTFSVPPSWNGSTFVADFNKDGFADYIAPSGFVYLGNGDGTFRQGKQVPGAANALGDVNGDGNVDILQVDLGGPLDGVLYVALGNGDGTFQPRVTNYVLPMVGIQSADLNGDGKADVVGASYQNSGTLLVYLSKGDGTFVAGQTLPLSGSLVTLADFNGDHVPDILIADFNGVTVLLGNGDGTFQAGKFTSAPLSGEPTFITGDFNNDGKLDIIFDGFELLLGNGDGTFQPAVGITGCGSGTAQAAGDFNGDGNLDLAVSAFETTGTCLGNGDGTFSTNYLYFANLFNNPQPPFVVADFNGDGKPDVAGGGFVLLGNGDGSLQGLPSFAGGFSATAGSFNKKGNGAQDVVEVIPNDPESIDVLVNDGKGKLSLGQTIVTPGVPGTGAVATGDFNGDGYPDAVYIGTDQNSGNWGYAVLLGNGDGSFQPPQFLTQSVAGTSVQRLYSIVIADFNNDNKLDIAVGPVGDGDLAIMLGNGDGTFSAPSYVFDGGGLNNNPTVLVGADFNGDGKIGIAASPLGTSNPGTAILLGNGDGTFQPATFPLGDFSVLAAADFNKDGKADLVGFSKSLHYEVLLGKGDGTFTALPRFADCSCLAGLTVADMNGDGIPDLFVDYYTNTNEQFLVTNSYSVYLGHGDGTFAPLAATGAKFTTEFPAAFNVIADLNGDGKPDVVTGNMDVTLVLLNNSTPAAGTITLAPAPGSPTSAKIAPGAKADFSLLLTPSGFFNASVSFACDVSPKGAQTPTCSVPATVQISGGTAAKVPVTVTAPAAAMGVMAHGNVPSQAASVAWTIFVFASISLLAAGRRGWLGAAIPAMVLGLIALTACGGGSGSGGNGNSGSTYTVTVTATMGKSVSTTTLTVTVQ
jgi:hypothetical protein